MIEESGHLICRCYTARRGLKARAVESLAIGATAATFALTAAQAADLSAKARPAEYVKVCSLYGAGFYYVPGTDTCIRIGGAIRLDTAFNGATFDTPYWQGGPNGANSYNRNYYSTRERFTLFVDTRTATDYGVVRTYATMQLEYMQGRDSIAGGFVASNYLFIQFAGFTFGKAVSMFDPQWSLAKPYISSGFLAGSNDATGIPMLAYTATFGSGVSATVALEDSQPHHAAGIINMSAGVLGPFGANVVAAGSAPLFPTYGTTSSSFLGNVQGGDHVPDIVANLRLDRAWGSAHIAAAAHELNGSYYTTTDSSTGHPSSVWGYAVSGAFEVKDLPTGVGDSLKVEAGFANGAAKYIFGGIYDIAGGGRFAKIGNGGLAFGYVLDGVYAGTNGTNGTGIQKSNAWDINAFYEHYWNPAWRTSAFGSYTSISYGRAADTLLLAMANGGRLLSSLTTPSGVTKATGSFDLGVTQIGTRTAWTPIKDLTLSAEFIYTRLDQHLTGTYIAGAGVPGYPAGTVFRLTDQSLYSGAVQILRSF